MTPRAIIIGVLLGLAIAAATYFNDHVIRQTHLIGSHLPASVFGVLVLILLVVNPLAGRLIGRGRMHASETAVVAALALAVCGFPGSGFFRFFVPNAVLPPHMAQAQPAWQAAEVMSYIPGGSPRLGDGHLRHGHALARRLVGDPPPGSIEADLWSRLHASEHRQVHAMADQAHALSPQQRRQLRNMINRVIDDPGDHDRSAFHARYETQPLSPAFEALLRARGTVRGRIAALQHEPSGQGASDRQWFDYWQREVNRIERRLNRQALADLLPEHLLAAPRGHGAIVAHGEADPLLVGPLLQGGGVAGSVPWQALWPTIVLWCGVAVLLGLASLGVVLVVHPQWSRLELLPYPVVRFLAEISRPGTRGWLPAVAEQRLFWIGLAVVALLHANNGLCAWFPQWIEIPRTFDFTATRQLFPYASRVGNGAPQLWQPVLYPSLIAFAFFLSRQVSLSVGLAGFVYVAFAAVLLRQGVTATADDVVSPLQFGGYVGMTLMILYIGRRHYLAVARGALGASIEYTRTPRYSIWGARLVVVCVAAAVTLLWYGGLEWFWGLMLIGCILMMFLVLCRMNVEAGTIFMISGWLPASVLASLFSFDAIGPTAFLMLAIAGVMLVGDPREAVMTFLANGFGAASSRREVRGARVAPWMAGMLLAGFGVALVVTLTLQYNLGVNVEDEWGTRNMPPLPYIAITRFLGELHVDGSLPDVTAADSAGRLRASRPQAGPLGWATLGLALVVGCWVARLRVPWWPLHPLLFVIWGNFVAFGIAGSFLIGWAIKSSVAIAGGRRGDEVVKPFMIGVVAGELLAVLGWGAVGAAYYVATGLTPPTYAVFWR